ncbi:MAG: AraC family transcriptional regulator [Woeseiaceae bacterium]|nr:AraC family transcriptional regulator [Woeseiaceae bacterium]
MREHPMIGCVERAARYLESEMRCERTPSLEAIATASGLSKFHFHRIYRLVTGETVLQTTTRLRLARGASALKDGETSVTEAAFVAGYSSSQAFAKAFKRELDQSASTVRSDPERLARTIRILSEPRKSTDARHIPTARIQFCSLDPFEILFIRTVDKYPELAETYGSLVEAVGDLKRIEAVVGIPQRDIETFDDGGFVFDAAVVTDRHAKSDDSCIERRRIDGGKYLIVRHTGPDSRLPDTLDALYAFVLGQVNIALSDAPCIHHFVDDPEEVDESHCRTDIYVKVEGLEVDSYD